MRNPERSLESSEDDPTVRDRDRSPIRHLEEEGELTRLISILVDQAVDERTTRDSLQAPASARTGGQIGHKLAEGRYKE